jgi:hypothetical protein
MCPEEKQLQRAEFAGALSEVRAPNRNVCVTRYIGTSDADLSLQLIYFGNIFWGGTPLVRNGGVSQLYRLTVVFIVFIAPVVSGSWSNRFASELREVQSAGGKLTRQKF